MKIQKNIQGKLVTITATRRGDDVDMSFEAEDDALRPVTMAVHTLWESSSKRLLAAIAERGAFAAGQVSFQYAGDSVAVKYFGESVTVSRALFEDAVAAYREVLSSDI